MLDPATEHTEGAPEEKLTLFPELVFAAAS
jgi:hypothetical protein